MNMELTTNVVRTLVAVGLLTAAAAKVANWAGLKDYLSMAVGTARLSPTVRAAVGVLVITSEGMLGIAVAFDVGIRYSAMALIGFTVLASTFLAAQLFGGGSTKCPCWGSATSPDGKRAGPIPAQPPKETVISVLRPAVYAGRNAAFCGAATYLATGQGEPPESSLGYLWTLAPIAIIGLALLGSVLVEWRNLRSPRHPRYAVLAAHLAPLVILDYYMNRPARLDHETGATRYT